MHHIWQFFWGDYFFLGSRFFFVVCVLFFCYVQIFRLKKTFEFQSFVTVVRRVVIGDDATMIP